MEFGGYQNFVKNGRRVAGLSPVMDGGGPPNVWSVYLYTPHATATAEDVAKSGGSIIVPPMAPVTTGRWCSPSTVRVLRSDSGSPALTRDSPNGGRRAPRTGSNATASRTRRRWTLYRAVAGAQIQEVGTGGDPDAVGPTPTAVDDP